MEPPNKSQTAMSSNMGSKPLSSTNSQPAQVDLLPRFHTVLPINWVPHQLSSAEKNSVQARVQASLPVNIGSYQLISADNQIMQMEQSLRAQTPMPMYTGFHQFPSSAILPSGMGSAPNSQTSMPINLGSLPSSATNKRPMQMESAPKIQKAMPLNAGSQQLSSTNKRAAPAEPPPKVRSGAFDSVRSKLRESLAAALALVSDQQKRPPVAEKSSPCEVASPPRQGEVPTPQGTLSSVTANASSCGTSLEALSSKEPVQKINDGQSLNSYIGSNGDTNDTKLGKPDAQEIQPKHDDEAPGDDSVVKDELLQGHGLCWASDVDPENSEAALNHDSKRLKIVHEEELADKKERALHEADTLALKIEAELFKLFGGVNKKYKEKGRSLLFNLKDRNNPELRERVLSGDIAPERLCTMTAEELASKELSEWRIAKAEELAQMVVLPDSDVDMRRLVKKTHKGEFQVEFEAADSVSVEVELGPSVLSQMPTKANEKIKRRSNNSGKAVSKSSKPSEYKDSKGGLSAEKANSGDLNLTGNLDNLLQEKTDLMQELMVDEIKDPESLPPVVSLDEFMEALDSEPPFQNLSMDDVEENPSSDAENLDSFASERIPESGSPEPKQDPASDSGSKLDWSQNVSESGLQHSTLKDPVQDSRDSPHKVEFKSSGTGSDVKSDSGHVESVTNLPETASTSDKLWEGSIQLNISSLVTVIGFFRSGEKTSMQEWPSIIEIKGRVRIDAFEKFLQVLPLSRSRAIMIIHFCWKEGSPESGRLSLCETVDSYVADERVGIAEPAPGVELYLCPPHPKTTEMLERLLPKEHAETLQSTLTGLIGVVVWRRPHVTVSPRTSSHHKHSGTKKQFSSRKQQTINSSATKSSMPPHPTSGQPPLTKLDPPPSDDDDVPPGFGPAGARDEDDLPEFDFIRHSSQVSTPVPPQASAVARPPLLPSPRPVEHMRALVYRYGQGESVKKPSIETQPWNDDDDIPEWQPNQDSQQAPPPPHQLHPYQQPFHANQHSVAMPSQSYPQPQQLVLPMPVQPPLQPLPLPLQPPLQPPQMGTMPLAPVNLYAGWQSNQFWHPTGGPADMGLPATALMQPSGVQFYGIPNFGAPQNGMGWRPDMPGSRGV